MYERQNVLDIRVVSAGYGVEITLVLFDDGDQYCSCCSIESNPVDYHQNYDKNRSLSRWEAEGGRV